MIHPDTELREVNPEIGYGVFATKDIPKGSITWALDPLDQVMDKARVASVWRQHKQMLLRYTWTNERGERILCWDFARYMNHHCEANTFGPGTFDFEIAVRDIKAGEQLTCDYATLNLEDPLRCGCGSPKCRGVVRARDFERFAPDWDLLIRDAFPLLRSVQQPLWGFVTRLQRRIDQGVAQPETLPSILAGRWAPPARVSAASATAAAAATNGASRGA